MPSSAHRIRSANAAMSPRAGVDGELGEDRRVHRLREDRVGRQERDEANWYATTPPATWLPITIAAPRSTATSACCNTDPRRQPEQSPQLAVDARRASARRRNPERIERDRRHAHEADAPRACPPTARISFSAGGEVEAGRRAGTIRNTDHRGDDEHRVGDRRHRRRSRSGAWRRAPRWRPCRARRAAPAG